MSDKNTSNLQNLGSKTTVYPTEYTPSVLETFDNKHRDRDYMVTFVCPEFTALCPITNQPDFGKIHIHYIPEQKMVESKSLKLYLFSFRNHGSFHEDCINIICNDLVQLMQPRYLEVKGVFMPRGGISIVPFANYATKKFENFKLSRMFEQLPTTL